MSDRTWVHLTLLKSQLDKARPLIEKSEGKHACTKVFGEDADFITFEFYECNYGDLNCEDALQEAGISFDKEWGDGCDYGPGTLYSRYTEQGTLTFREIYDAALNPSIDALLKHIDEPDKLRQYILDHHNSTTPLSWDNQDEYAKRFRARQLISSI